MISFKVFKLFLKNDIGNFRYYFLFPVISSLIGGYIIFITLSIMNGMESNLINRFKSFNYINFTSNLDNEGLKYFESNNLIRNKGFERISIINTGVNNSSIIVKCFSDLDGFISNKLDNFIISYDSSIKENNVIIGDDLAKLLNVQVGDSLVIKSPVDINLSTKHIPYTNVVISHIFDINIYDYDSNYIIASLNTMRDIYINANINYFLDDNLNISALTDIESSYDSRFNDLLIKSINFEKYIYASLGYFVFIITFFMLFSMLSISIVQKNKQIKILHIMGLSSKKIFFILFNMGFFINVLFCIIGYVLAEVTILLNIKFGLFGLLFGSLPFALKIGQLNFVTIVLIIASLSLMIGLSVSLPLFFNNKEKFKYA